MGWTLWLEKDAVCTTTVVLLGTMAKDVKAYVQAYPHCQWYNPTVQPVPPIIPKLVPQRPFSEISLDWVGLLPVSYLRMTVFSTLLIALPNMPFASLSHAP
jgi:hypothetical protein